MPYDIKELLEYGFVYLWKDRKLSKKQNTKERPLHKSSQDQRKSPALGGACNFAELCITMHPVCDLEVRFKSDLCMYCNASSK